MKVTFYGHSTFLVDTGSHKLIFDPFITPNPAAGQIDASKIKVDFILLSHAHFDHVVDVELLMEQNPDATIIANAEIAGYYEAKGFKNTQTHSKPTNVFIFFLKLGSSCNISRFIGWAGFTLSCFEVLFPRCWDQIKTQFSK
jgi:L-ascorbate metabolism protein UlaG (beta-lactamase superfamily)